MADADTTAKLPTPQDDPAAFDRFADIARKVLAAPREEVERRIEASKKKRVNKRDRTRKAKGTN